MLGQALLATPSFDASFHVARAAGDATDVHRSIRFRCFVMLPAMRTLLRGGTPVVIGDRAFDLLLVLLRARGSVVSKAELMRQVWPATFVDECNLRFQINMLRRALGDDRDLVRNVTGRGYLLIDE